MGRGSFHKSLRMIFLSALLMDAFAVMRGASQSNRVLKNALGPTR